MNRWLYRAAGTVGVAGGFLLLGTGGVHADQAGGPQDASGEAFAPTGDLPPLNLSTESTPVSAPEQAPAPAGSPELLPPLDPSSLLGNSSPLGQLPLGQPGSNGPLGLGLPVGDLPLDALPLNALPLEGLLNGSLPTDNMIQIKGQTASLPAPVDQVPALIADQLAAERNWSPDQFPGGASTEQGDLTDGLPMVGNVLQPITGLVNVGNLPAQLPVVGQLVGPTLGTLPVVEDPIGSASAAFPSTAAPSGDTVDGRPIVDEYPEYSW